MLKKGWMPVREVHSISQKVLMQVFFAVTLQVLQRKKGFIAPALKP